MSIDLSIQQQVICGDVLEWLPKTKPAIIISDPPYGIAHKCDYQTRKRGRLAGCNDYPDVIGDDKPFDPKPILDMDVPTILWGANHFADKLPASGGWLVWDKERPPGYHASTCEMAWTNCVSGVRIFRHRWHGFIKASERGESYHPTQKPVALFSWILSLKWIPDGLVVDPYAGACPLGVACRLVGKPYIGIEMSEAYCKIGRDRMTAGLLEATA